MSYSITAASPTVSEAAGTLSFTIARTDPLLTETLYVSTTPNLGFANSGDYQGLLNLALTFAAGELTKTITIAIYDDAVAESNETFGIILQKFATDPVSTYLAKSSFTIIDNDVAPPATYAITPADPSVDESIGTLTFTVTRSASVVAETVYVSTTPNLGFANSGDYTGLLDKAVNFAVGQTSATVTVKINDDNIIETSETFGIIVQRSTADPVSTYLAKSSFTILDNDTPPTTYAITPDAPNVDEAAGTVTFTVTRSASAVAETVFVSTAANLGFANAGDYADLAGQALSFAVGQTSATVTLQITDDAIVETNESFGIIVQRQASDPVSTYLAKSSFTIIDNDTPPTTYAIIPDALNVDESAGTVTFTVTRSASAVAETVYVSTAANLGFANAGDYADLAGQALSFAVGQASATFTLQISDDKTVEANESFGLLVQRQTSDPVSTYLAKTSFTIIDNDSPPPPPPGPAALGIYPATGIDAIGQGNRDNDDSHSPGTSRQWAYDFLAPNGTDVHSVSGGTVVAIRQDLTGAFRGFGNLVTIRSDDGYYVSYGHLTAFSSALKVNDRVEAGQIIAKSGDSGSYDGTSLHPNLHVQFGSSVSLVNAKNSTSSTATLVANGAADAIAPAYFPKLVIDFAHRADPGLSTDSDYYGASGIDDFTGNDYGNNVFGAAGDDILRGMGGNDTLQGGTGSDTLIGGAGKDKFVYYALNELGDFILDFTTGADRFQFKGSEFGGLATGTLQASQFQSLASNAAVDGDDRFIFNTADTTLWYDADGNGALAPIFVADLQAGAKMAYSDIVII